MSNAIPPSATPAEQLTFDPDVCFRLLYEEKFEALSELFLKVLDRAHRFAAYSVDDRFQVFIDNFLLSLFYAFCRPRFVLPDRYMHRFIEHQTTIGAMAARSSFKSTEGPLAILMRQPANFVKLLTLFSLRNLPPLAQAQLFDVNAELASHWWRNRTSHDLSMIATPTGLQALRDHVTGFDSRLTHGINIHLSFFLASYLFDSPRLPLRTHVNDEIQAAWANSIRLTNRHQSNHIAIVTDFWTHGSAMSSCTRALVMALKAEYQLTLIHSDLSP